MFKEILNSILKALLDAPEKLANAESELNKQHIENWSDERLKAEFDLAPLNMKKVALYNEIKNRNTSDSEED